MIRNRFKKLDFFYDRKANQYLKAAGSGSAANSAAKVVPINKKTKESDKNYMDLIKQINKLQDRMNLFEEELKELKTKSAAASTEIKIDSKEFTGDLKTRSFKVYENVLNDFIDFCNDNKNFRQQDLMTQALFEFMKNHQKEGNQIELEDPKVL